MKWVSYTRSISSRIGEENPSNTIAEQNERMVYLYDDQTMKIEFNCEDVIRRALEKYGA